MAQIDSIIFDLDGTLVDSQPAAIRSTTEALSNFGIHITDGRFGNNLAVDLANCCGIS